MFLGCLRGAEDVEGFQSAECLFVVLRVFAGVEGVRERREV